MKSEQQLFSDHFNVSRETMDLLSIYEQMLGEWNIKFNLVSTSTLPHIWTRHFLDSAQLFPLIPDNAKTIADMGSGAGFPGLVLAIMSKGGDLQTILIEGTGKKADFLQAVVDRLKLNVTVRRERIEAIKDLKADVITARALKALPELLQYANRLIHKDTICLFLKGKNLPDELTEAQKYWTFRAEIHPSRSDETGKILQLQDLRYKTRR